MWTVHSLGLKLPWLHVASGSLHLHLGTSEKALADLHCGEMCWH